MDRKRENKCRKRSIRVSENSAGCHCGSPGRNRKADNQEDCLPLVASIIRGYNTGKPKGALKDMKQDFEKFIEYVKTNEPVQKKLEEAGKNYTGEQTEEAVFGSIIAPIAKEAGFDIAFDDAKQSVKGLNLDEMGQVDGGGEGSGAWGCIGVGVGIGRHENTDDSCIVIGTGAGGCFVSGKTF